MSEPNFTCTALRVRQPIGTFWIASIPAEVLLQATVPDPLRCVLDPGLQGTDEWRQAMGMLGNQRELLKDRAKQIARYVDSIESTFPNSIILAANSGSSVMGTEAPWRVSDADGPSCTLSIPASPLRASVVDGQHRLYSFLYTELDNRRSFELVCAVFFDIPQPIQAMIFATINTNQKPVRRGMALNLYGYNIDDEDRAVWSPEKLAVFISRRLNFDRNSGLFHRIKIEAEGAPAPELLPGATRAVPLAALVDGILSLISRNPKDDRDTLRSERLWNRPKRSTLNRDDSPLREWFRSSADHQLYELIREFVGILDTEVWDRSPPRSMLTRAVGIRALFGLLGSFLGSRAATPSADDSEVRALLAELPWILELVGRVDFSDPYFEATGRGQKRIQNVLLVAGQLTSAEALVLPLEDREQILRLVEGRSSTTP